MNPKNLRQTFAEKYVPGAWVYTILVLKGGELDLIRAVILIQYLLAQFGRLTFLIEAEWDRITWKILDIWHKTLPDLFIHAIQAIYPEAQVEVFKYQFPPFIQPFYRSLVLYRLAKPFEIPMKEPEDHKPFDPLVALVNSMQHLRPGERVSHWVHVLGQTSESTIQRAYRHITVSQIHPLQFLTANGAGKALGLVLSGNTRSSKYRDRDQRLLEDHLAAGPFYDCSVMTEVNSFDRAGLARISNLAGAILQLSSNYNGLVPAENMPGILSRVDSPQVDFWTSALGRLAAWFDGIDPLFPQVRLVLNTKDLTPLWHLPHQGFTAPDIFYIPSTQVPLPPSLARNTEGVCLGTGVYDGRQVLVRLRDEDRDKHMTIWGKTGMGKSSLMRTMIHQDIQNDKTVIVIDPHGPLISDICQFDIPDRFLDRTAVFDLSSVSHPFLGNLLRTKEPLLQQFAASQIVAALDKADGISAPLAEDGLYAALLTLMQEEMLTMRDISRLFIDPAYRYSLLTRVSDPIVHEWWQMFEQENKSMQRDLAARIIRRMRYFYRNPYLYPILCHPDPLNLSSLIVEGTIILVSLGVDERMVPTPDQDFLGMLLVTAFQMAIMQDPHRANFVSFYIDESQRFANTSLNRMLSEARKYHCGIVTANQFMSQIAGPVLESILGNVGTTVVFQCGLNDDKTLAPYFAPEFTKGDLMNLHAYQAAVKMHLSGQTLPAFTLQTVPPPVSLDLARAKAREEMIRQKSITRYTPKTREEVLAWLDARYPRISNDPQENDHEDPNDWSIPE